MVSCTSPILAEAYARWLSVPLEKRPVEIAVLGILRKSALFEETKFVSLAQALEGFERLRFPGTGRKGYSFESLIGMSYDLLDPDFAKQLVGERTSFSRQVVDTRTYYVHIGKRTGPATTLAGEHLLLLNRRLETFIRCLMLLELGIPKEYLEGPLLYQASKWWLL